MMILPGEQFVIRRQAYAMIKEALDENAIKFAFPTVQVAGEGDASATAPSRSARWSWPSPRQHSRSVPAPAPQGLSVALRSQACAFSALLPEVNRPPN
jgi:hypothetical protein